MRDRQETKSIPKIYGMLRVISTLEKIRQARGTEVLEVGGSITMEGFSEGNV